VTTNTLQSSIKRFFTLRVELVLKFAFFSNATFVNKSFCGFCKSNRWTKIGMAIANSASNKEGLAKLIKNQI
jgi:hypothetical protein